MTGEQIHCEYEAEEMTVSGLYHYVWHHLPQSIRAETNSWNIQLLTQESVEENEDLLETVRQGGVIYLLVHTDRHLEISVKKTPFYYTWGERRFTRRVFCADYRAEEKWSGAVEVYLGWTPEGTIVVYHAEDVFIPRGHGFDITSMKHPCSTVYDLLHRIYEYSSYEWDNIPSHLTPVLYQEWQEFLEEHTEEMLPRC